jgi:hypothetical protein
MHTPPPWWSRTPSLEEEKEMLQEYIGMLKEELEMVEEYMKDIEKSE